MDLIKKVVDIMLEDQYRLEVDEETRIVHLPENVVTELTEGISLEEILGAEGDVLGWYTPMSSPGVITLNASRLKALFWHMVHRLRNYHNLPVVSEDLPAMAHLVTLATYHHEYFHFFCDIQRRLFPGAHYNHLMEEALAVAYSYLKIDEERSKWQSIIGRMTHIIYRTLLIEKFRYTAPGYKEWILYSDQLRFAKGLSDYIDPPGYKFLEISGVSVDVLFSTQLNQVYQFRVIQEMA